MRISQIKLVWSQAIKKTLTSLSCLAGRSRWCTGQEIKAHLCKPIFPTCQLKTEKLVFHRFLKGIGPFSFGVQSRSWMWSGDVHILNSSIGEDFLIRTGCVHMESRVPGDIFHYFSYFQVLRSSPGVFTMKFRFLKRFPIHRWSQTSISYEKTFFQKYHQKRISTSHQGLTTKLSNLHNLDL